VKTRTIKTARSVTAPAARLFTIEDLWKEVQGLREALETAEKRTERQAIQIKKLEDENAKLQSARAKTEDFLQALIRKLELGIAQRDEKLEEANKQLTWLRTGKFGSTSEQGNQDPLKKEIPAAKDSKPAKQKNGTGKNPGQQPGSKGHGRSDRSELDTNVEFLTLPDCACGKCGEPYRLLPRTEASPLTEIEISIVRTVFQRCIYVSQCKCEGKKIVVAPPPPKLHPRTAIGNSLWVHLVVQKFLHGQPQNRVLKELELFGLHWAAGTVTGGCAIIDDLLEPLMEKLISHCQGANLWNADETMRIPLKMGDDSGAIWATFECTAFESERSDAGLFSSYPF
jgi:hypothetical protein